MRILLDTNVIIDFLTGREPFYESARQIMKLAETGKIRANVTANSITDIFYILRKQLDQETRKVVMINILKIMDIISLTGSDILKALEMDYKDFEDAVQTQCAKKIDATYIVTRNEKDFKDNSIPAISPDKFILIHNAL